MLVENVGSKHDTSGNGHLYTVSTLTMFQGSCPAFCEAPESWVKATEFCTTNKTALFSVHYRTSWQSDMTICTITGFQILTYMKKHNMAMWDEAIRLIGSSAWKDKTHSSGHGSSQEFPRLVHSTCTSTAPSLGNAQCLYRWSLQEVSKSCKKRFVSKSVSKSVLHNSYIIVM